MFYKEHTGQAYVLQASGGTLSVVDGELSDPAQWNATPIQSLLLTPYTRLNGDFGADPFFYPLLLPDLDPQKLSIESAAIFRGIVMIAGQVFKPGDELGRYDLAGWGFAYSTDDGDTWQHLWNDSTDALNHPHKRGQYWVLNVAPVWHRGETDPSEAWFICTDYQNPVDLERSHVPDPTVGRLYIIKAKQNTSGNWVLGYGTSPSYDQIVKTFDFTYSVRHAHSAMATEFGTTSAKGVQIAVSLGDGRGRSRFVRFILPDKDSNYLDSANWIVEDKYHGHTGLVQSREAIASPQPVGAAYGTINGEIIWGSDNSSESLFAMQLPTSSSASPNQAQFLHLYGFGTELTVYGNWFPQLFRINQPTPERVAIDGPLLATLTSLSSPQTDVCTRFLYTPAVTTSVKDQWCQPCAPHSPNLSGVLFGDWIYFTNLFPGGLPRRSCRGHIPCAASGGSSRAPHLHLPRR